MSNLKILYIASASRSGSTLLEHVLGSFSDSSNCGELRRLGDFYRENEGTVRDTRNSTNCTCGEKVRNCPFWKQVEQKSGLDFSQASFSSELGSLNRGLFKLTYYLTGPKATRWLAGLYPPFRKELVAAENIFRLYNAIAEINQTICIIDASKILYQFLMLKTAYPDNVKILTLVRDGRAVATSMVRGNRKSYFKQGKYADSGDSVAFKAAVTSWMTTTVQILLFHYRQRKNDRYLIKYEDICDQPEKEISQLRTFLGLNTSHANDVNAQDISHTIGGSPARHGDAFLNIATDNQWRENWDDKKNSIFSRYGFLLNKFLGYKS